MKRIIQFILLASLLLTFNSWGITATQPADNNNEKDDGSREKVLIDFTQFESQNDQNGVYPKEPPKDWEKDPSKYVVTSGDMVLDRWVVRFNSSSQYFYTKQNSYTKKITTKKNETVLGARIHFPNNSYDSHAYIQPLYEIMEFNDKGELANVGNGVVKNVSAIKWVAVEVSGRNYRNRLTLRLMNQRREIRDFFMGYLDFAGWRRLIWKNLNYISNVDQRRLFRAKLYPQEVPYYKFHSFIVSRPDSGVMGDFVVYFKKVTMNYDLHVVENDALTINDEEAWGIKKRRNLVRQAYLKKINSNIRELRLVEERKMGKNLEEPSNKPTEDKKPDNSTATN